MDFTKLMANRVKIEKKKRKQQKDKQILGPCQKN